jgi:hypothetical protein
MKKIHFSKPRYIRYPKMTVSGLVGKHQYRTICGIITGGRKRTNRTDKVTCKACIAKLSVLRLEGKLERAL